MSPSLPAGPGESWHNHGHDVASILVYVTLLAAPVLLAARFRRDPGWAALCIPLLASGALTVGLLALFLSKALEPWNGIVQRIMVSIPLVTTLAWRSGCCGRSEPLTATHSATDRALRFMGRVSPSKSA